MILNALNPSNQEAEADRDLWVWSHLVYIMSSRPARMPGTNKETEWETLTALLNCWSKPNVIMVPQSEILTWKYSVLTENTLYSLHLALSLDRGIHYQLQFWREPHYLFCGEFETVPQLNRIWFAWFQSLYVWTSSALSVKMLIINWRVRGQDKVRQLWNIRKSFVEWPKEAVSNSVPYVFSCSCGLGILPPKTCFHSVYLACFFLDNEVKL